MAVTYEPTPDKRTNQGELLSRIFGVPLNLILEDWKAESWGNSDKALVTISLAKVVSREEFSALINGLRVADEGAAGG